MNRLLFHIGPALRLLRVRRRMKQVEVARGAVITPQALSLYENSHRAPSIRTLSKLLDALEVRLVDLGRAVDEVERLARR